jgi:hypothetical protein
MLKFIILSIFLSCSRLSYAGPSLEELNRNIKGLTASINATTLELGEIKETALAQVYSLTTNLQALGDNFNLDRIVVSTVAITCTGVGCLLVMRFLYNNFEKVRQKPLNKNGSLLGGDTEV